MPKQSNQELPRWKIVRLKGTPAADLGTVRAKDAESAIKTAIEEFRITDPQVQARLAAYRV